MEHTDLILYIELRDGQPINHPIFHDNFVQAFPDIDPDNLPADRFAKFIRVSHPDVGVYEIYDGARYEWVDGVVKDIHQIRQMTDEEKAAKQKVYKDIWAAREQAENWSTWTFDEETCQYVPPIPKPDPVEGKMVAWCGAENNWKEVSPPPKDGNKYWFDFLNWKWESHTNEQST